MSEDLKKIREYLDSLKINDKEIREELENIMLGYMHDCRCLSARVRTQEAAINKLHNDLARATQQVTVECGNDPLFLKKQTY